MKARKVRERQGNARLSSSRQRRQQHLLDVNVRSRRAAHHRNRRLLVAVAKVGLVVAICGGIYFGVRAGLSRFFFNNPDYAVSTIAVQTDGTLQRDQILKAGGLREGVNIFSVNLAGVRERLRQLAQVDDAQVERKMPNEIDVHITERKPIAWITSEHTVTDPFASDVAFLVDARGILMKEKKLLPEYLALPLIVGCSSEDLVPGKPVATEEAKTALELLRLNTTSFMQTRFQIREIDLSKGYCLLVTDKNHTRVMFGFDHLKEQMQRLERFLVYSDDAHREIATVNLLVARNIPVTFANPVSEVISELDEETESSSGTAETKEAEAAPARSKATERKAEPARAARAEPQIRRAIPVRRAKPLDASPGVKKFHSPPSDLPVRRAIPVQKFDLGEKSNG